MRAWRAEGRRCSARWPRSPAASSCSRSAGEDPDSALVGGAVRDLLLGREPRELDVVVAGGRRRAGRQARRRGAAAPARGSRASPSTSASARPPSNGPPAAIDIAERRAESYPHPGLTPTGPPGHGDRGPPAPGLHRQRDRRHARRPGCGRGARRGARGRGSRRRAPAGPARAELHRRPHPAAADGPLRGAPALRAGARHRGARPAGARGRCAEHPQPAHGSVPSCAWRCANRTRSPHFRRLAQLGALRGIDAAPGAGRTARAARP